MKYNVGDKVKIKSWNQLAEEFGMNETGAIECKYSFIQAMKPLCGQILEIDYADEDSYLMSGYEWMFSDDMIEKCVSAWMTVEEAKAELKVQYLGDSERIIKAKSVAVDALEKQDRIKMIIEMMESMNPYDIISIREVVAYLKDCEVDEV